MTPRIEIPKNEELRLKVSKANIPLRHNKNTLNLICEFAIANDVYSLEQVKESGVCMNMYAGLWSPIMKLAANNETKAVTLLLDQFDGSAKQAIIGFAFGGHDESLSDYKMRYSWSNTLVDKWSAYGYAFAGNFKKADQFPRLYITKIMRGYGAGHHYDKIKEVCGRPFNYQLFNYACIGFGQSGKYYSYSKMVENQFDINAWNYHRTFERNIIRGLVLGNLVIPSNVPVIGSNQTHPLRHEYQSIKAYCESGNIFLLGDFLRLCNETISVDQLKSYLEPTFKLDDANTIMRIISCSHGNLFRNLVLDIHIQHYRTIYTEAENILFKNKALEKSNLNYDSMHRYSIFNFKLSSSISTLKSDVKTWIIEGGLTVRNGLFPKDVYFLILTHLIGLPLRDSLMIYNAIHERLFKDITGNLDTTFRRVQNGLYRFLFNGSASTIDTQLNIVTEHYQQRLLKY